jgi:hypothetical protein
MKRLPIRLAVLALLLSFIPVFAETTVEPGYQLKNGMAFNYLLIVDTKTTQVIKDQTIKRNDRMKITYAFQVTGEKKGRNTPARVTVDSIFYELDGLFAHFSGDVKSDSRNLPKAIQPYASFVGADFMMDFSNQAAIKTGLSTQPGTDDEDSQTNESLTKILGLMNSGNTMVKLMFPDIARNIFISFPSTSRPLKSGASWNQPGLFSNGVISPTMKVAYTVGEIRDNSFQVTAHSKSKFNKKQTFKYSQQRMELKSKLAVNMEQTIEIDKHSGLPLTGEISIEMTGIVTRLGINIPTTLQMTIHFEQFQ